MSKLVLVIFAAYLLVLSTITFIMYKVDKVKAEKKKWRIRESTLLGLGFFGGAFGALAGMELFRHKTKHWYFWLFNVAGIVWQVGLLVFLVIKFI